jgi:meso-butanediol dehydrogenase/(S,S)-butanediol dehydrogenase/diacetyl reductase
MIASPSGGQGCAVVLISSQFGLEGMGGFSASTSSKFAVRGLMQVAAQEFAPKGIRVNAICPGREYSPRETDTG